MKSFQQALVKLADSFEHTTSVFKGFFIRVMAMNNILESEGIYTKDEVNEEVNHIIQANRKDSDSSKVSPE